MNLFSGILAAVSLAALCATARATSVVPVRADTLAADADLAVRAIVESVDERAAERLGEERPLTLVRLRTLESLKGEPGRRVELRVRGGLIGERRLTVHGMPSFAPGEEVIVLVRENGSAVSPVMAFGYGVFRVERPRQGAPIVRRNDGTAVVSLEQTGLPLAGCDSCTTGLAPHAHAARPVTAAPMRLENFTAALRGAARDVRPGGNLER